MAIGSMGEENVDEMEAELAELLRAEEAGGDAVETVASSKNGSLPFACMSF